MTQLTGTIQSRDKGTGRWRVPAGMIFLGVAGFIAVSADVVYKGLLTQWDRQVHTYFFPQSPWGILIFSALSGLGELKVILALAVVTGVFLIRKRRWRELAGWIVGLSGSGVLNGLLKGYFRIPRPAMGTFYVFKKSQGFSYPSGHTMGATIALGMLALVLTRVWGVGRPGRWLAAVGVASMGMLVSYALVYMGVHYVSDVLGGLMVALTWLGVMRWVLPPADPMKL